MLFLANTTKNITVLDSLLVLLLGMLIIFLVLALLIFVVKGYVGVFALFSIKDKQEKVEDKTTTKKVTTTQNTTVKTTTVPVTTTVKAQ